MLGSETEEVDMEALASAVDDLSIDPIEDEVDIAVIKGHQQMQWPDYFISTFINHFNLF